MLESESKRQRFMESQLWSLRNVSLPEVQGRYITFIFPLKHATLAWIMLAYSHWVMQILLCRAQHDINRNDFIKFLESEMVCSLHQQSHFISVCIYCNQSALVKHRGPLCRAHVAYLGSSSLNLISVYPSSHAVLVCELSLCRYFCIYCVPRKKGKKGPGSAN